MRKTTKSDFHEFNFVKKIEVAYWTDIVRNTIKSDLGIWKTSPRSGEGGGGRGGSFCD